MRGQVIYLNIWHNGGIYQVDDEELRRRRKLQDRMDIFQAEIDYQSREYNEFQKMIYKEQSHNNLRASWQLVIGDAT
jgi:hypothetical protein